MKKKYIAPLFYIHFTEIKTAMLAVSGEPEEAVVDEFDAKESFSFCYDDTEEEYYPICWE